tara:strand:+ start:2490 stop:3275 length:786 start_codon:yes stop_codon:yes gene_type:complete
MKHSDDWRIHKMDYLTRELAQASADACGISVGEWINRAILKVKAETLPIQNQLQYEQDSSNKSIENTTSSPKIEHSKTLQEKKKPIKFRYLSVGIVSTIILVAGVWTATNHLVSPHLFTHEKKDHSKDISTVTAPRQSQLPSLDNDKKPLKNNTPENVDAFSNVLPSRQMPKTAVQTTKPNIATEDINEANVEKYIRKIQALLNSMNFDAGSENGNLTIETVKAIKLYQKFSGLEADGKPSKNLLNDMQAVADAIASKPYQ